MEGDVGLAVMVVAAFVALMIGVALIAVIIALIVTTWPIVNA